MGGAGLALLWIYEAALLAAALGVAAAATGAQAGRWSDRWDHLTHFAIVFGVAAAATLLLGLFHRPGWRKALVCILGVLTAASAADLIAPRLLPPRTAEAAPHPSCRLKIIEFNSGNARTSPGRVARWIASESPDVVVVLEAAGALEARIKALTGYRTTLWDGILVASRWEPARMQTGWPPIGLPGTPLTFSWADYRGFGPEPIPVIAVHPGWPIPSRRARSETARIVGILDRVDRRSAILVGDFNSTQFSFRHRQAEAAFGLERRDVLMPTWPDVVPFFGGRFRSPVPFLLIDHIYAGSNWRTVEVRRGPRLGSDHYPLVATLAWVGPPRTGDPATSCAH